MAAGNEVELPSLTEDEPLHVIKHGQSVRKQGLCLSKKARFFVDDASELYRAGMWRPPPFLFSP